MSASAQKVREGSAKQSQTVANLSRQAGWTGLFPNKVDTSQKSVTFVKKLLSVSISNISYLRSMFSEDAYAKKSLGGMPLQILREKSGNEEAEMLSKWLIGAFEAIELNYLKDLVFFVYIDKDKPEEVYEKYTFHFNYHDGEARFDLEVDESAKKESVSMSNIQDTTRSLLRSIVVVTQALKPLPPSAHLAMKLSYYENCPEDYEPKGFAATTMVEDPMPSGSYGTRLGAVDTKHHGLQLRMDTRQDQVPEEGQGLVSNTFRASQSQQSLVSQSQNPSQSGMEVVVDVDCACGNLTVDPLMLRCVGCQTQQHGACYRVISEEMKPAAHICVRCHQKDGRQPCTDPKLPKMLEKNGSGPVAMTCLYRRIILSLREANDSSFIDSKILMGRFGLDSNKVAEGFLTKLGKEGILRTEEEVDGTYAIVIEKIDEAMKKYFGIRPKEEKLVAMVDKMTKNLEIDNRGDRRSKLKRTRNAAAEERNNSLNDRLGLDEEDNVVAQGSRSPRDERMRKRIKRSASKQHILSTNQS